MHTDRNVGLLFLVKWAKPVILGAVLVAKLEISLGDNDAFGLECVDIILMSHSLMDVPID